jgi:hypothetical protein
MDTDTCKALGSDAGYPFDYSWMLDGFHTIYYNDKRCTSSNQYNDDLMKWNVYTRAAKIWIKLSLSDDLDSNEEIW